MDNVSAAAAKHSSTNDDPFRSLTNSEAFLLRRQVETPVAAKVTWRTLFRFASLQDLVIIAVSSTCAIAAGAALPLNTVILGSLAGAFQDFTNGLLRADFDDLVNRRALFFVYLAIGEFVAIYVATVGFKSTGESITRKIREQYLKALLAQNSAYFDLLGPGEIITRIADTNVIQEGISEKIELLLSSLSTFFAAYIIGFVKFWKLTLILSSMTPVLFAIGHLLGRDIVKYSRLSSTAHARGGIVVEEALSSIRTVAGHGTQEKLANEYDKSLTRAEAFGRRMKSIAGSGPGFTICIFNLGYALASWMGSKYIVTGETDLSAVLTILLAMMLGSLALVKASQHIQAFANAVAAATDIYATIDRIPPWHQHSEDGIVPQKIQGRIEFRDVRHIYPSRPDVVVLQNLNLVIPAGSTLAITGASGCGKSSIIALIERFYSPVAGEIAIDENKIEDLDLSWLRQQIGLVSQDPVLFSGTVEENILHGLRNADCQQTTRCQSRRAIVEQAAKLANAHDFISELPDDYDTFVGERGSFLSGGQRQRIAIARAVVGNPKILICDEATSALDSQSEGVVQAALQKAAQGRTTIMISHRMSTIRNANSIVVLGPGGTILEQGTYDELFATKASFYDLVEAQNMVADNRKDLVENLPHDEKTPGIMSEKPLTLQEYRTSGPGTHTEVEHPAASDNPDHATPVNYSLWSLIKFTASLNRREWRTMLLGIVTSIIAGAGEPVQCVILAKSISTLSLPPSQFQRLRSDANFWSGMFVMIAFVMLACCLVLGVCFAYGSERLMHRSRHRAFRSILRQDIRFFDLTENTVGSLTSFLNTETTRLAGMSGVALGTIFQLMATLIIGYIVALAVGWKLAFVCIATVPILLLAGFLNIWSLARFEAFQKDSCRDSASYACEVASSTRTIAAFTLEEEVCQHYHVLLAAQASRSLLFNLESSLLYAASQSLGFLCMALCFWYGSSLLGEYSLAQFYLVFFLVIFGTRSAANMFSLAPDMAKAKSAAADLKQLFERTPAIDVWNTDGDVLENFQGSVEFREVGFAYKAGQSILKGMSFLVQPGQYVALVGSSGCGKSTTISLLERFYDPSNGGVYVDGKDISTLNLKGYRKHLALVSQEPTLYQGTIRDNLLLAVDNEDIPEEQIIKSCKEANIYDFITSLPAGFDTVIGSKGGMLSGGQKQRIAIARALLREPEILLLDEATSALDSDSESVVQAALDAASKGRTTIAVAHRLSTVRNADAIYVLDGGRVVESGTHTELMGQRGRYFEMVHLQSAEKSGKGPTTQQADTSL